MWLSLCDDCFTWLPVGNDDWYLCEISCCCCCFHRFSVVFGHRPVEMFVEKISIFDGSQQLYSHLNNNWLARSVQHFNGCSKLTAQLQFGGQKCTNRHEMFYNLSSRTLMRSDYNCNSMLLNCKKPFMAAISFFWSIIRIIKLLRFAHRFITAPRPIQILLRYIFTAIARYCSCHFGLPIENWIDLICARVRVQAFVTDSSDHDQFQHVYFR